MHLKLAPTAILVVRDQPHHCTLRTWVLRVHVILPAHISKFEKFFGTQFPADCNLHRPEVEEYPERAQRRSPSCRWPLK
jgi:ApbE superfamily uncharacterized protein (UPF0280 family)